MREPENLTRRRLTILLAATGAGAMLARADKVRAAAPADIFRAAAPEGLMRDDVLPDLWIGSPDAKISIIEYASVTCSHCAAFHLTTYKALKAKYIETGKARFVMREFPSDPGAMAGFMLARCDGDAIRRDAMLELLFAEQRVWTDPANGDAVGTLSNLVRRLGMSHADFENCLRRQDVYEKIIRMRTHAVEKFGVDRTPTFFINGEKLVGNQLIDAFERIIEPLLR